MLTLGNTPLYDPQRSSRAINAENPTGTPGAGGTAAGGRKGSPCLMEFKADAVHTFAEIEGPGVIRHIWLTVPQRDPLALRNIILRFFWDGSERPNVVAPLSDFFGVAHGRTANLDSVFLSTPEGKGFNCFFPMPFARSAKLTICNETGRSMGMLFYHVDYTVGDPVDETTPRFHAWFTRTRETTMGVDHVILPTVRSAGRYLGCVVGVLDRYAGRGDWWGEGEVKFYLDGDREHPTICGTGTEDYAGTAWGMGEYNHRYYGSPLNHDRYISFYRFHAVDPIYFHESVKVTIQQIGNDGSVDRAGENHPLLGEMVRRGWYRKDVLGGGNHERVDDVCSTAFWYQRLPAPELPPIPGRTDRSHDLLAT